MSISEKKIYSLFFFLAYFKKKNLKSFKNVELSTLNKTPIQVSEKEVTF